MIASLASRQVRCKVASRSGTRPASCWGSAYSSRVRSWPIDRRAGSVWAALPAAGVEGGESLLRGGQRVHHRPREQPVHQQELDHLLRVAGPGPGADEGLVGAAGAEQHRPAELIRFGRDPGHQQPRGHVHPFQAAAQHQEPPGLVVAHRGLGQAEEQGGALPDELQVDVRPEPVGGLAAGRQPMAGDVEALPHLAGDDLADAARAAPGGQYRAGDRARVVPVVGGLVQGHADVQLGAVRGRDAQHREQGPAVGFLVGVRLFEHPVHVHIDHPGGVVRTLDVPAGPEQGLGDPAEQPGDHC